MVRVTRLWFRVEERGVTGSSGGDTGDVVVQVVVSLYDNKEGRIFDEENCRG